MQNYKDFSDIRNDLFFVFMLLFGTVIFVYGFFLGFSQNGSMILTFSSMFWVFTASYKGTRDWIISSGLIISALVVFIFINMNQVENFLGLFLILLLIGLAFIVRKSNTCIEIKDYNEDKYTDQKILCPHCNEKNPKNSNFCSNCGSIL